MTSGPNPFVTGRAVITAGVVLFVTCAAAQDAPQAPANPPPRANVQPGMLESAGRWFTQSFSRLGTNVDGAREAARGAADAAREAVARWPKSQVVSGRVRCEPAPNRAPDCHAAAASLCKDKGFASGASLDIQSARKCPARVWLSGRPAEGGECETQAFVTRAVCQ